MPGTGPSTKWLAHRTAFALVTRARLSRIDRRVLPKTVSAVRVVADGLLGTSRRPGVPTARWNPSVVASSPPRARSAIWPVGMGVGRVEAVPTPSPPTGRHRWFPRSTAGRWLLVALLVATALFRMTQNMASTTLSLLAGEAVHVSAAEIGVLGAGVGLVGTLVTLLFSRRVPHHRAAASATWSMAGLVVSLLVLAVAPSFGVLAVGAVLLGVVSGVAMPGLLNAIASAAGAERERVIALYTVTLSVSLAVGPFLETVVLGIAHQDVRVPYVLFTVFPLVAVAVLVNARRRRRRAGPVTSGDQAASTTEEAQVEATTVNVDVVGDVSVEASEGSGPGPTRQPGLFASRAGRTAMVAQLLYNVPFSGITVFGALVARRGFGVTAAQAELGFTVFFVCSFLARASVAWRSPITAKHALLWLSAALTVAGLALIGTGHGLVLLLVAMGVLGIPHGLTFPLALALVAEATPIEALPRANATLLGSTNLSSVVVPLALGAIVPTVGYQGMMLTVLVPVVVLTFVELAVYLPHRNPS